jgi:hypothetical protein
MNKFLLFMKLSLFNPFKRSFIRFTDAIILGFTIAILTYVRNQYIVGEANQIIGDVLKSAWLILPLLICKNLTFERLKWPNYLKYLTIIVVVGLGVGYYFLAPLDIVDELIWLRYAYLLGMLLLLTFTIPYIYQRGKHETFIIYLVSKLFATLFYSAVLYGGIILIVVSVEALFNLSLSFYIYINVLVAIAGFVTIPVFLGFIPDQEEEMTTQQYYKIWRTIFSLIIVPLVTIFTFILIIYLIVSLFGGYQQPGLFVLSTIIVSFTGLFVISFVKPFIDETPHLKLFSKYFPWALPPLIIGYFYEVIKATIENGISINAAVYIYLGIWITANIIMSFFKRTNTMQIKILSLVDTLALISIFPFINVVSLTKYSLNNQFESKLIEYEMLSEGNIIPRNDLTEDQKNDLYSLVNNLQDVGFHRIKYLPDGFTMTQFEEVFGFLPDYTTPDNPDDRLITINLQYPLLNITDFNYEHVFYVPSLHSQPFTIDEFTFSFDSTLFLWAIESEFVNLTIDVKQTILTFIDLQNGDEFISNDINELKIDLSDDDYVIDFYFITARAFYNNVSETFYLWELSFYLGIDIK